MADNTIQTATDGNFEAEVLTASNSQPVMVDFWAEWCRPCHMLAPTVAEIAHDYAGKLKVMKLNVDEAMNSAGRYRVQGIPTLLLFKNGQVADQMVGGVRRKVGGGMARMRAAPSAVALVEQHHAVIARVEEPPEVRRTSRTWTAVHNERGFA